MGKTIIKISNKKTVLLFIPVFIVSLFLTILSPVVTVAYQNNDELPIAQQHARTELYAIGVCFEINDFASSVSGGRLNSQDIWGNTDDQKERTVSVGHEIDPEDGLRECRNLDYNAALGFIGMTWNEFRDIAYTQNETGAYSRNDDAEEKLDKMLQQKREGKRQSKDNATGPKEKNRRVLVGLAQCIQTIPADKAPENKKVTINGKNFQYRDDRSEGSTISVGHDLQQDGRYTCGTFINLAKDPAVLAAIPNGSTIDDIFKNPGLVTGIDNRPNVAENAAGDDGGDCDGEGLSAGWIICGIVEIVSSFSDYAFNNIIQPIMEDTPLSTNQNDPFYRSWQGFRFIGNTLLIISMLAIVYSQARGGD